MQPQGKQLGLNTTGASTFRNRLINGGFAVNQRGFATGTAASAGFYAHDRWKAGANGCTYTFTQTQPATTITITANTILQVIEAANVEGGTYTLSWAGTATARVYQGAASGSYAASPLTVTGLSANTATTVEFAAGTLGKAQFEPGTAASAFELRPYGVELSLCQRYYQTVSVSARGYSATASGQIDSYVPPVAPMRIQPATALTSAGTRSSNLSGATLAFNTLGGRFEITANAVGDTYALFDTWSLNAEL